VSFGMVRAAWERTQLPAVPAEVRGELPRAFVVT
jgi:hypothetical protein